MAVVINTNVDSIRIRHDLTNATNKLSTAMQRMSTGLKVLSAKDDAAGTVIASRMKVQLDGNKICQNNVQNGNAMLQTIEGNIDVILDNVSRIRDLTLEAKNGTYSEEEIQAMQDEVQERIAETARIATSSKHSQLLLFNDTDGLQKNGITFQVGANSSQDNTIHVDKSLFADVSFSSLTNISDYNLTEMRTKENYDTDGTILDGSYAFAVDKLDAAIDDLTDRKSKIGSAQNRLESALDTLTTQEVNLSNAKSIITDADIAEESSTYTQSQILQQVATSLLAQANQAPGIALSLI